jgi:hypothetical protein
MTRDNLKILLICGILITVFLQSGACAVHEDSPTTPLKDTTILSAERKVDWGRAGVWVGGGRGIPSYPVGITVNTTSSTSQYYCDPTGATDCRAKLQAALNACPDGQAVYMPAGTYRINSTINIPGHVVIRGAGPTLTTIKCYANAVAFAMTGANGYDDPATSTNLSSGYTKGSQTVVVANAAAFSVGDIVIIDQTNDPSFVNKVGSEDTCSWCSRNNGNRSLCESNVITNKNGNTITLDRPLAYGYNAAYAPQMALQCDSPVEYAGVEDLAITPSSSSFASSVGVEMQWTYSCWVKNCDIYGQGHKGVHLFAYCVGCEVRDSYIHDMTQFDSDHGYQVNIQNHSSWNLIENNIMKMGHNGIIIGSAGGTANVVAYNYLYNTKHYQTWWFMNALGTHGAHTYMNLFEGNIAGKIGFDYTHGSGSHHVCLRNQFTDSNPGVSISNNLAAVDLEEWQYASSFIGNVLGYPGYNGAYENVDSEEYSLWNIFNQSVTRSALIRHGNYDYVGMTTRWDTNISDHNIPISLYLDSRPSWFGSLDWPAIGPDVAGYVKNTPAKQRWDTYVSSGQPSDLFVK